MCEANEGVVPYVLAQRPRDALNHLHTTCHFTALQVSDKIFTQMMLPQVKCRFLLC